MMNKTSARTILAILALATPAHAVAQNPPPQTPKGWSYQVDPQGRRIARNSRVVNPDGSWREEIRQGNCLTVKERSATGEYKESRQCNPAAPK